MRTIIILSIAAVSFAAGWVAKAITEPPIEKAETIATKPPTTEGPFVMGSMFGYPGDGGPTFCQDKYFAQLTVRSTTPKGVLARIAREAHQEFTESDSGYNLSEGNDWTIYYQKIAVYRCPTPADPKTIDAVKERSSNQWKDAH